MLYIEENETATNETGNKYYQSELAQAMMIDEKYTYESIHRDEPTYNDIYKEYVSLKDEPINYKDWLIMNKPGILDNAQNSELHKEISGQEFSNEVNEFIHGVERSDILETNNEQNTKKHNKGEFCHVMCIMLYL